MCKIYLYKYEYFKMHGNDKHQIRIVVVSQRLKRGVRYTRCIPVLVISVYCSIPCIYNISEYLLLCVTHTVTPSCPTLCNLMDCSMPGSSVHGISPSRNTGIGSHFLLQGILPTQRSNQGLSHCSQILYLLSHLREAHSWGHKRAGHDFSD